MTTRRWRIVLGLALMGLGGFLAVGPTELVLLNSSLRLQYPWTRGAGALLVIAGLAVVAWTLSKLTLRLLCGVLAIAVFLGSLRLFCYQIEATDAGLVSRDLLQKTAIAWKDVRRVQQVGDNLLIIGPGETRITVDTTDFEPEQRASLERTISRRVRESAGPVAAPAPKAP